MGNSQHQHQHQHRMVKRVETSRLLSLSRRDIDCPSTALTCNCSAGETCVQIARTKTTCAYVSCIGGSSSSGGGINPGVIAGPVVAVLLIVSVGVWWYLRRKKQRDLARLEQLEARAKKAETESFSLNRSPNPSVHHELAAGPTPGILMRSQPSSPLSAEFRAAAAPAQVRVYSSSTINLDPSHPSNRALTPTINEKDGMLANIGDQSPSAEAGNPFTDRASIATSGAFSFGSQGTTNVIPIAYVPPSSSGLSTEQGPIRPARSPDLNLRLNPMETLAEGRESATPTASSFSSSGLPLPPQGAMIDDRGTTQSRASMAPSFLSFNSGTFAMDIPTIMTGQRAVNIGTAQRAAVVQLGPGGVTLPQQQQTPLFPTSSSEASSLNLMAAPPSSFNPSKPPTTFSSPLNRSLTSKSGGGTASKSPLSQQPLTPSAVANPFSDQQATPRDSSNMLGGPSSLNNSLSLGSAAPPETTHSFGGDDLRFSMGSLGSGPRGGGGMSGMEANRMSTASGMSSQSGMSAFSQAAVIRGATVVRVGEATPTGGLFRSGSLKKMQQPQQQFQQHQKSQDSIASSFANESVLNSFPFATNSSNIPHSTSQDSLPRPPPIGAFSVSGTSEGGDRTTQYSLGAFDFMPPGPAPPQHPSVSADEGWGKGPGAAATTRGSAVDRASISTTGIVDDLKGFNVEL